MNVNNEPDNLKEKTEASGKEGKMSDMVKFMDHPLIQHKITMVNNPRLKSRACGKPQPVVD